jgi:hypothetical protein
MNKTEIEVARDHITVGDVAARTRLSITAVSRYNVRKHAKIDTKGPARSRCKSHM